MIPNDGKPEEIQSLFSNVNDEITNLVSDVECYQDLKYDDYVKSIHDNPCWKAIKEQDRLLEGIISGHTPDWSLLERMESLTTQAMVSILKMLSVVPDASSSDKKVEKKDAVLYDVYTINSFGKVEVKTVQQ